jgi:hypothetical protein
MYTMQIYCALRNLITFLGVYHKQSTRIQQQVRRHHRGRRQTNRTPVPLGIWKAV